MSILQSIKSDFLPRYRYYGRLRMRQGLLIISGIAMVVVLTLSAAGCAKRAPTSDPLGNITLVLPYPFSYAGAPTDKISVQYAVIEVARQAGIGYEWNTSSEKRHNQRNTGIGAGSRYFGAASSIRTWG